ncbi:unnamed protein product [Cochlearia groenlandica]
MEALYNSTHISTLPSKSEPILKYSSQSSSCWLCNSPSKRITNLRIRDGSSHGLRIRALLHNQSEDNMSQSNGFGLSPGETFFLSQEKLESYGDCDGETSHSVIDVETSLALPQGGGGGGGAGGGNRGGLFRTPISGGVQNATSAHALPRPALAVRNLLEQARYAHLCTMMSKIHHRRAGYPFGSMVDFTPDRMGHPLFLFSPLTIHSRNLLVDPRCSLVVQIPGWSGLSNARVTLFGDVYPLSEDEQEWAHKQYIAKHPHGLTEQWGNFQYFRMRNISDIYFIGGFGTVAWVDVKEYETLQPDKIAVDCSEKILKELNAIFSKPLRELLSRESEIDDAALISIDSKGIDIRVRQGAQFSIQRLPFEGGRSVETLEEAKSALYKVVEKLTLRL